MKKILAKSVILTVAIFLSVLFVFPSTAYADGTKIAFHSYRDGNNEIYIMNADGSGQTRLTDNAASDVNPSMSPDGTKIAFASNRDGNYEIYIMNVDGSGQTRLTDNSAFDNNPSISPDGTKIAYASSSDGDDYDIYIMNIDGTVQTPLTNNAGEDITNDNPCFSPDGTKIAFEFYNGENYEIYIMNVDGSNKENLTESSEMADLEPCFSPDGTKIAYASSSGGGYYEIYLMNADGTDPENLTNHVEGEQDKASPCFSPDGTKIAFASYRDDNWEIYIINVNGTGLTNLTTNSASDGHPSFGIGQSASAATAAMYVEPVWIRNVDMTCSSIWVNEDNDFEFVFFWEYANNSWVKIYDMSGNEVFSIDMPYGDAHFTADLPDGMYTVKTFHNDMATPLQEFVIGKP